MRYRFIEAEKAHDPVQLLCRVMGVARRGFSRWRCPPPSARAAEPQGVAAHLRACSQEFQGRDGSLRLHRELQARGIASGRHRVARLMRL